MQTPDHNENLDLSAPPPLVAELRRVSQAPDLFIPRTVDEAVLRAARKHLEPPAKAQLRGCAGDGPGPQPAAGGQGRHRRRRQGAVAGIGVQVEIGPHGAVAAPASKNSPGSVPHRARADYSPAAAVWPALPRTTCDFARCSSQAGNWMARAW